MTVIQMHDWVLLSVLYEWKTARVTLSLKWRADGLMLLVADGVSNVRIPQLKPWGPSVSINKVRGPTEEAAGRHRLEIEMQTGDLIEIEAASFAFPTGSL